MKRLLPRLLLLSVPLVALVTARPAAADDTVVAELERLVAPSSDGGGQVTLGEAATFAATIPGQLSGDEALIGIAVAQRLRGEGAFIDEAYGNVVRALRYRVRGLAVSMLQAPGLSFARATPTAPLAVAFDAAGVDFTRVDLVYTWDGWATTRAASLVRGGGDWRATLPVAPATGRLEYALHVFGCDSHDAWLNGGVEHGVYGGNHADNYSLELATTTVATSPTSAPVLAKLVRVFTHPASPGGAAIVSDEFSALVEQVTWEGGPGIQDDDVLNPAIHELETLVADGADFAIDPSLIVTFLDNQRLRFGALPLLAFRRDVDGRLHAAVGSGFREAELFWSTDGWNLPRSQRCADHGGTLDCDLGYLPRGVLLAYTLKLVDAHGQVSWQYVERGLGRPSNFFHRIP